MAAAAAPVAMIAEEWVPAGAMTTPLDGEADGRFLAFDPSRLHRVQRNPDGRWLRLRPMHSWPSSASPLLLIIERLTFGDVVLWLPGATSPVQAGIVDHDTVGLSGVGAPVFELPPDLPPQGSLLLYFPPQANHAPSLRFTVEPMADYLPRNALWVAAASACLAAMTMMMVTALVFLAILRDRAYLLYAVYLGCFIVLQAIHSGYLFTVLHWHALAPAVGLVGKLVTVTSVISACLFLLSFTRMRQFSPRMAQVVLGYVALVGGVLGLGMLPVESVMLLARATVNPLLALGALLLPVGALLVWSRGSRYGGYFLLGWVPLMAVTFAGSMQSTGAFADWAWLGDALLPAGAFEGLILAVGLADRALAQRHRYRETEVLSTMDPLTAVMNRRAWEERFLPLVARAHSTGRTVYVMFVDLDRFKSLNDAFGHRAGDEALRAVAAEIRRHVPAPGLVCRYGGEEFVAALVVSGGAEARAIAETVRAAVVSLGIPVNREEEVLTLSIGLAQHRGMDESETTIEQADHAMYRAKSGGRNRVIETYELF